MSFSRSGYNSGYGNKGYGYGNRGYSKPAPTTEIRVTNAPPRAAQKAPTQYKQSAKKQYTKEEKELIKATRDTIFRRVFDLAVLPGNIPMCFAVSGCLVTDYVTWADYAKNALMLYAEKLIEKENGQLGDAPFAWGFRPISTDKLDSPKDLTTVAWIFSFIAENIAPYDEARDVFVEGLGKWAAGLEQNSRYFEALTVTRDFVVTRAEDEHAPTPPLKIVEPFVDLIMQHVIPGIAPIDLKTYYETPADPSVAHVPRLANLKNLQNARWLARVAQEALAKISATTSRSASPTRATAPALTPRAPAPAATPRTPAAVANFLTESESEAADAAEAKSNDFLS
jgi:hypothetical protein